VQGFLLHLLHARHQRRIHAAKLDAPLVKRGIANPVLAAQLRYRVASFGLLEDGQHAIKRVTKPMLSFKLFRSAANVLAGIELMHMIRKGQFVIDGASVISFGDQFYALA
jgi:putative transposase